MAAGYEGAVRRASLGRPAETAVRHEPWRLRGRLRIPQRADRTGQSADAGGTGAP